MELLFICGINTNTISVVVQFNIVTGGNLLWVEGVLYSADYQTNFVIE